MNKKLILKKMFLILVPLLLFIITILGGAKDYFFYGSNATKGILGIIFVLYLVFLRIFSSVAINAIFDRKIIKSIIFVIFLGFVFGVGLFFSTTLFVPIPDGGPCGISGHCYDNLPCIPNDDVQC